MHIYSNQKIFNCQLYHFLIGMVSLLGLVSLSRVVLESLTADCPGWRQALASSSLASPSFLSWSQRSAENRVVRLFITSLSNNGKQILPAPALPERPGWLSFSRIRTSSLLVAGLCFEPFPFSSGWSWLASAPTPEWHTWARNAQSWGKTSAWSSTENVPFLYQGPKTS